MNEITHYSEEQLKKLRGKNEQKVKIYMIYKIEWSKKWIGLC